jgi:PAS domain S-box-containing protein
MPNPILLDQELLHTILESIPLGVILFEQQGQILFANSYAEKLLNFQPGEWRHQTISCMFLEEDCDIFLPNIIKLTKEKGRFEGEALLRNRQNREFFAHFSTFLYGGGPTAEIIIAAIHDIDTLKKLQRGSIESDRLRSLGKVVDQMAHHIRNPIAAIGGFAARLLRRGLSEKDRQRYQEVIFHEANRLDGLLKNLANFTTLPLPSLAQVSLHHLLDRAIHMVPQTLRTSVSAWHTPPPEELRPLTAFMDLEFMARCLANVFTNALESGNSNVAVTFRGSVRNGTLQLTVTDNGSGITPEDLPLIFDPLFTTKDGHVGLGLTISQRIIQDHAGTITVQSEVRQGTTVAMEIPQERRRPIRVRRL